MTEGPLPVLLLEEHHEAFLAWWLARRTGLLGPLPFAVLHVDEHADWALPRFTEPLALDETDVERVAAFVYRELDIGTFLWAAVYHGLLNRVSWFRVQHIEPPHPRDLYMAAYNAEATEFITGSYRLLPPRQAFPDCRTVHYEAVAAADRPEFPRPLVLDIDLDFFASNRRPDCCFRVEVVESSYRAFLDDRYHPFRMLPGGDVAAAEEDGRFFLVFGSRLTSEIRHPVACSEEAVNAQAQALATFLERSGVVPELITISRSVRSGYTPRSLAPMIERVCLQTLDGLYGCDVEDVAGQTPAGIEQRVSHHAKRRVSPHPAA